MTPDGQYAVVMTRESIRVWDIEQRVEVMTHDYGERSQTYVAMDIIPVADQALPLVLIGFPDFVRSIDLNTLFIRDFPLELGADASLIRPSPDGTQFFVLQTPRNDREVRRVLVYDVETKAIPFDTIDPDRPRFTYDSALYSPDGSLLAVQSNGLRLYDTSTWEQVYVFPGNYDSVRFGEDDKTITVRNTRTNVYEVFGVAR